MTRWARRWLSAGEQGEGLTAAEPQEKEWVWQGELERGDFNQRGRAHAQGMLKAPGIHFGLLV